ncbi:MAG: ParB/RepB/Spo0J family partition protein [Lysobacterales bacterium]
MTPRKRGLGRGLDALLRIDPAAEEDVGGEMLKSIRIDALTPGRFQPRKSMDAQALSELAASIKTQGMIQPIVVRATGDRQFEIIAGERRWRAAREVGLKEVPCVVREADDRATIAMAIIENIQREDLAPLEEAAALQRLIDEFGLTHQKAADAVGRSRAAVSNLLRLLELPPAVRQRLEAGEIEMGHARALLTLPAVRAEALAERAFAERWSVRELEAQARRPVAAAPGSPAKRSGRAPAVDADVAQLQRELGELLAAPVAVEHGRGGRGKVVIRYFSLDELDGLIERLRGNR